MWLEESSYLYHDRCLQPVVLLHRHTWRLAFGFRTAAMWTPWRNPQKCHIGHHFCSVLPVFSFCSLIFGCLSKYVGVYWELALLWQSFARPPRPKPAQWPFSYSAWLRYNLYSTFSQDTEAYISTYSFPIHLSALSLLLPHSSPRPLLTRKLSCPVVAQVGTHGLGAGFRWQEVRTRKVSGRRKKWLPLPWLWTWDAQMW